MKDFCTQNSVQEQNNHNGKDLTADNVFTVIEAANYLKLSRSMVYNLMESGKLRYAKFGSSRRIPLSCCKELIEASLMGGWNIRTPDEDCGVQL